MKKTTKVNTSIRITKYELERAKKIATKLKMKLSEYWAMILHDANEKYNDHQRVA